MAKNKKDKLPVIYNIDKLSLEIDYDKLADAIVKAQEKAREDVKEKETKKETGGNNKNKIRRFFVAVWEILKGEKSKDGSFLAAPYVIIVSLFFKILFWLGIISAIAIVGTTIKTMNTFLWQGQDILKNILYILTELSAVIVTLLFSLIFKGAANDMGNENDKNYAVNAFSGIVCFVALIVAIIALNK